MQRTDQARSLVVPSSSAISGSTLRCVPSSSAISFPWDHPPDLGEMDARYVRGSADARPRLRAV